MEVTYENINAQLCYITSDVDPHFKSNFRKVPVTIGDRYFKARYF